MVALLVHAILGIITIAIIIKLNPAVFKRVPAGPQLSTLEIVLLGCRHRVAAASAGTSTSASCTSTRQNPFWGQGDWSQFIKMGFANPASSSQCADYTIGNVILLPLFTIIDGRRRGIRHPWLFFVIQPFHQLRVRLGLLSGDRRTAAPTPTGSGTCRLSHVIRSGPPDCTYEGSSPQLRNPAPARLRQVGVPRTARRNRQRSGTDRHWLRVEGLQRSRTAGGTLTALGPPGTQPFGDGRQSG